MSATAICPACGCRVKAAVTHQGRVVIRPHGWRGDSCSGSWLTVKGLQTGG